MKTTTDLRVRYKIETGNDSTYKNYYSNGLKNEYVSWLEETYGFGPINFFRDLYIDEFHEIPIMQNGRSMSRNGMLTQSVTDRFYREYKTWLEDYIVSTVEIMDIYSNFV
jgi:hypothetical protein